LKGQLMIYKNSAMVLAALALSTVGHAQNITVTGVIDIGMQYHDNGTDRYSRASDNGFNASRISIRGTEDLGHGLRANFQLEGLLHPSTGSAGTTASGTTNEVFNREAWVGISGPLGEIRVGRQDVTGAQDIDAFVSQTGLFGFRPVNGTRIELGVDQPSVVKYISPSMDGLSLQLGWASANTPSATTDAATAGDQRGAFASYTKGALKVFVGMQDNQAFATTDRRGFTAYGASYDFGFISVGASHAVGDVNNSNGEKNTSNLASIRMPISKSAALHAVYAVAQDRAQPDENQGRGYSIVATNALSKRTTLYAAYTAVDNEANSRMFMQGQAAAPATAGLDTATTFVGISHTF
jgi:predicted porin